MAAVKIQHKNCLQRTLRKKIINTLFAGLGRSVLGKTVPSVLGTAQLLKLEIYCDDHSSLSSLIFLSENDTHPSFTGICENDPYLVQTECVLL